MIFNIKINELKYDYFSRSNQFPENHVAIDIIERMRYNNFDFKKDTYKLTHEDKDVLTSILGKRIDTKLFERKDDSRLKQLLKEDLPTQEVKWKDNLIEFITSYDKDVIDWIFLYGYMHDAYVNDIDVIITYSEEDISNNLR